MANITNIPYENLLEIKRHLQITWNDTDTDRRITDMMQDAIDDLNDKIGAEPDYFSPGSARQLFKNYMLYAWNGCLHEFDSAYLSDILRLRHKYAVLSDVNSKEN